MRKPWETSEPSEEPEAFAERMPLLKDAKVGSESFHGDDVKETWSIIAWYVNLKNQFGRSILGLVFICEHVQLGFVSSLSMHAGPWLIRKYDIPAPHVSLWVSIATLPFAFKPIIGLLTDMCPIFGYHKAPYMLLATLLGMLACLAVGALPHSVLPFAGLVICFFCKNLSFSTCQVVTQATYSKRIQAAPEHGPALMAYVWFGFTLAQLVATLTSGYAVKYAGPKATYFICAAPAFFVLYVVMKGYLGERKVDDEQLAKTRAFFFQQKEVILLSGIIFLCMLASSIVTLISRDTFTNMIAALIMFFTVLFSFSLFLTPVIAKFNAFNLIQMSFSLEVGTAAFYFYTDKPWQFHDGPHFTPFFMTTVLGTISAAVSLVGIGVYQRFFSHYSFRTIIVVAGIAGCVLNLSNYVLFSRANLKMGIPDWEFALICHILEAIVTSCRVMPHVIILSYLCPKGMEATMVALLGGVHQLGSTVAGHCSAYMLAELNIRPRTTAHESVQFDNLPTASLISTVFPFITLFLALWLVPDVKQGKRVTGITDATAGSLWKRLTSSTHSDHESVQDSPEH